MDHKFAWTRIACLALIAGALAWTSAVHAQVEAQGSGKASGSSDIELGATQPTRIEMNAGTSGRGPVQSDGDIRLALQLRLDAINTLSLSEPGGVVGTGLVDTGHHLLVPIATPGVRIIEDRLFLGLGFGFVGASTDDGPNEESRSGFSLSPLVSYDVLDNDSGAFSLLGWLNLASLGETEQCTAAGCADQNDDAFGWGVALGAGLRGFLSDSLAIGGEFGWGFLTVSSDGGPDAFVHGVFGNLVFEASLML